MRLERPPLKETLKESRPGSRAAAHLIHDRSTLVVNTIGRFFIGPWRAPSRRNTSSLRATSYRIVARGRTKERLATTRAIRFIVRQGDNGVVWNILSFWRATV